MNHCVASYNDLCQNGKSSIWSLRMQQGEQHKRVVTMELNFQKREIVQVRRKNNHNPHPAEIELLQEWADASRIDLKNYALV